MNTNTIVERWFAGRYGAVRYWESGPKRGLPVLLIHGYGAMIEHWRAIMRPIAEQHTLYALDLHFFGRSAIPSEPPSRDLWAAQVAEFIAAVCPGPAIVVGHSMGGMVAAQLTISYPFLVQGLVLTATTGLNDSRNQPSTLDNFFFSVARAPGIGETLAGVIANERGARQGLLAAYYRKERVTPELVEQFAAPLRRPGGPAAYLAVTRAFPRLFLAAERGAIKVPTLLLWGAEDRSVPVALAEYFKRTLIPQADIAIIPESGHCAFDETPEACLEILLPWIEAL